MISIAFKRENENDHIDSEQNAKRKLRNTIRRIRRAIGKNGMDLHYHDGEYYPVAVHRYGAIDVEAYGRKVGAIQPIGICVCRHAGAWRLVEGVALCDECAAEVRR